MSDPFILISHPFTDKENAQIQTSIMVLIIFFRFFFDSFLVLTLRTEKSLFCKSVKIDAMVQFLKELSCGIDTTKNKIGITYIYFLDRNLDVFVKKSFGSVNDVITRRVMFCDVLRNNFGQLSSLSNDDNRLTCPVPTTSSLYFRVLIVKVII